MFSILFIVYSRNTGHSFWVYWTPFTLNQMTAVQMAVVGRRYAIEGKGYATEGQITRVAGQAEIPWTSSCCRWCWPRTRSCTTVS